ncbi:MAG TPA: hypothetical protein VHW23_21835, partial [Kofleriaceae bacterium]|nr:hypothetical protein [Kofleriaceae bacterium]
MTRALGLALVAALAACGTTGGKLVSYDVVGRGPPNAGTYDTSAGWHVALSTATLYIGAVYLNQTRPNSGIQGTECILPSVYTGEELEGRTIDVLSAAPQPFPAPGTGTDDEALTGEIWLTGGDVNAATDSTVIADLKGTATRAALVLPFTAQVTISVGNRGVTSPPAQPSLNPICKRRIVSPVGIDLRPHDGGTLVITVDPSKWFNAIDFTQVPVDVTQVPAVSVLPDDNSDPASNTLFTAIGAAN